MSHFFISYQRNSLKFAQELAQRIGDAGLLPWIDQGMKTGDEWKQVIDTAIQKSLGVIVVITPDALKSQYVTYEWSYAMGCGRTVLPLIREFPDPDNPDHPKIHPKIDDRNYRDFTNPKEEDWQRIISELHAIEAKLNIPQPIIDAKVALSHFDPSSRRTAIHALEVYEHEHATEALAEAIATNRYPDVVTLAALALARKTRFSDERAIEGIARALGTSELRRQALDALISFDSIEAVDTLGAVVKALEPRQDSAIAQEIVKAMSRFTNPAAIPFLIYCIETEGLKFDSVVRGLERFADPRTLMPLFRYYQELATHNQKWEWHVAVVKVIANIDAPDTLNVLFEIMKLNVRYYYVHEKNPFDAALLGIIESDSEEAVHILQKAMEEQAFQRFKQIFSSAIAQIRSKQKPLQ